VDARCPCSVPVILACDARLLRRLRHPAQLPRGWRSVIELLTGAFDQAQLLPPTYQVGTESRLHWIDQLAQMPGKTTLENTGEKKLAGIVGYQHPDHDTEAGWQPPKGPGSQP
jgi:hypothetical protein